jgi:hypothetical protein
MSGPRVYLVRAEVYEWAKGFSGEGCSARLVPRPTCGGFFFASFLFVHHV